MKLPYEELTNSHEYDYVEELCKDIRKYIDESGVDLLIYDTLDDAFDELEYDMMNSDDVCGNGSPYGYFHGNEYLAECAICHNFGLLCDALEYFDVAKNATTHNAIYCDTTIRCYLLDDCLHDVLYELLGED